MENRQSRAGDELMKVEASWGLCMWRTQQQVRQHRERLWSPEITGMQSRKLTHLRSIRDPDSHRQNSIQEAMENLKADDRRQVSFQGIKRGRLVQGRQDLRQVCPSIYIHIWLYLSGQEDSKKIKIVLCHLNINTRGLILVLLKICYCKVTSMKPRTSWENGVWTSTVKLISIQMRICRDSQSQKASVSVSRKVRSSSS